MCTRPGAVAHALFRGVLLLTLACTLAAQGDIRFTMLLVDGGAAESAAVADFNKDGKLDIVSAESWYEGPRWTKRPIRTIPVKNGYVDSFSDLPLDVDRTASRTSSRSATSRGASCG